MMILFLSVFWQKNRWQEQIDNQLQVSRESFSPTTPKPSYFWATKTKKYKDVKKNKNKKKTLSDYLQIYNRSLL